MYINNIFIITYIVPVSSWPALDPFSFRSFRVLGFLYISASNQAAADAKVVLTLCTPTYIQQGYTFIVNADVYSYATKSELL